MTENHLVSYASRLTKVCNLEFIRTWDTYLVKSEGVKESTHILIQVGRAHLASMVGNAAIIASLKITQPNICRLGFGTTSGSNRSSSPVPLRLFLPFQKRHNTACSLHRVRPLQFPKEERETESYKEGKEEKRKETEFLGRRKRTPDRSEQNRKLVSTLKNALRPTLSLSGCFVLCSSVFRCNLRQQPSHIFIMQPGVAGCMQFRVLHFSSTETGLSTTSSFSG